MKKLRALLDDREKKFDKAGDKYTPTLEKLDEKVAKEMHSAQLSLAVLVDDNETQIRTWLKTPNRHTGGVPGQQLQTVDGLVTVCGYLDAIRGKV